MKYTYTCPLCEHEVEGDLTPERPAPVCSNHDSPAFSDPGEGADWDGPETCPNCHEDFDLDDILDKGMSHIGEMEVARQEQIADDYRDREIDKEY